MKKISVIIPCYNEEESIEEIIDAFYRELNNLNYNFEYIFVDDGSSDKTLSLIKKNTKRHKNIKYISFSRNFGKEAAIYAGLKKCSGDYAILIDADMQQHPSLIKKMINEFESDSQVDIVAYYQKKRIENIFISLLKKIFYRLLNKTTNLNFKNGASDFRMFNRKVINSILMFSEHERFHKGIFSYIGFNTKFLPYVPNPRKKGKSKWSFSKKLHYGFSGIFSYSCYIITLPFKIGVLELLTGTMLFIILIACGKLGLNILTILCIILFLFSLMMFCIGIMGKYIYIVFIETKGRPVYIERESSYE